MSFQVIMLKKILVVFGFGLSLFLLWFAVSNYRAAGPIAEENLRGLAVSLAAAIENTARQDPSFKSLTGFHPSDVAFFAIIDRKGTIRFHSNSDLIGSSTDNRDVLAVMQNKVISESRVVLGTGEKAYLFDIPLDIHGEVFALRLTLHTYKADAVVRRARLNFALLLSLLAVGWFLAVIIYRFAKREERHQMEMAHRESLARLGEMGAMLAHEIRNPLAGIKGYAQVIEKRPAEERNRKFAQSIVNEVLRLENLVNELLAYVRNESTSMNLIDSGGLISHAVSLIRQEAEQLHVAVSIECPENLPVLGNSDRLVQVLLNLFKNALQAMPDGGTLRISAGIAGSAVSITVADSGAGISQEDMARIFEPFFTTKARGTGLGLALCKKIIGEHNGTISVSSRVGQGTSVSITLPLQKGNIPGGSSL